MCVRARACVCVGLEYPGVHECLVNSIKASDLDIRRTLYRNIVLAGGTTTNQVKYVHPSMVIDVFLTAKRIMKDDGLLITYRVSLIGC